MSDGNPFDLFVVRYRADPVAFVREVLGVEPDPWQITVLRAYGRRARGISVRSCHGPGKTAAASWCALHHLVCFAPQKTAVTAPTAGQAFDSFFTELKFWFRKLPPDVARLFVIKQDGVEHSGGEEQGFLRVKTARKENPEALQGIHAPYVLLIVDEASGVDEEVFEAAGGSMSGADAITLLISNPTRTSGTFYETHHALKGSWVTVHVSWKDSPRVSPAYEASVREQYGEDSNVYRVRVLGEFATEEKDVVIPFEYVAAAMDRDIIPAFATPTVWGLDVARGGRDRSALCKRKGPVVLEKVRTWQTDDLMVLTGYVMQEWNRTLPSERPTEILVDAIGLGSGVVDRLREIGAPARGINVGETPAFDDGGRYKNLRTELWFRASEWFRGRMCRIPAGDADLVRELTLPCAIPTSDGAKIAVEPKDETRKRYKGRSPDVADAFVLTFASTAAVLVNGPVGAGSWNAPLKRNLRGIV